MVKSFMFHYPKIDKSLGCPYCNSSNVTFKMFYTKQKDEIAVEDDESIVGVYKKNYKCHCLDCEKDYYVDYGYEKYVIFNKPIYQVDNEMLAWFGSDSEKNYEIIRANLDGKPIYFIMDEVDPYPIFIRESEVDKYLYDVKATKSLIRGTFLNRYR